MFGSPSCGPHLAGSHSIALVGMGGKRHADLSQRESLAQSESVAHPPCACWQVHGPPQMSLPAQTTSSPALQFGVVQPQLGAFVVAPVVGSFTVAHGH